MSNASFSIHGITKIKIREVDSSEGHKWRHIDLVDDRGDTTTITCFAHRDNREKLPVSFVRKLDEEE